jgi:hypothetical protein
VECQCGGKEQEEIMQLLPNLVPNLPSEDGHWDTDEKAARHDQKSSNAGKMRD